MRKRLPKIIFEIANCHGGKFDEIMATIKSVGQVQYANKAIKFQLISPNTLATQDYKWYKVYQKLEFTECEWLKIIGIASKCASVWLDIFDEQGVLFANSLADKFEGIKLQASVLQNYRVRRLILNSLDHNIKLMINISGYELDEIKNLLDEYSQFKGIIILQFGFQDYPTALEDSLLCKIQSLKMLFPEVELCFADHLEAGTEASKLVPLAAWLLGASILEKHFVYDRSKAEYDHFSAIEPGEMREFVRLIEMVESSFGLEFRSEKEIYYLESTQQKMFAARELSAGALFVADDAIALRSDRDALCYDAIKELVSRRFVLSKSKKCGEEFLEDDFRQARIGILVACRLKSSRLERKALLVVDDRHSVIELCLINCLAMSAGVVVLCTSVNTEDDALVDHITNSSVLAGRVQIFRGDEENLIKRFGDASKAYDLDVVIRVTGDCPLISPEIAQLLLDSHFIHGADYSASRSCSVGTGCEVFNASSIYRLATQFPKGELSEYLSYFYLLNPNFFRLNIVDLPATLSRSDIRLTVDYIEDFNFIVELLARYPKLLSEGVELAQIFNIIDSGVVSNLNAHCPLVYKTDEALIARIEEAATIGVPN